MDEVIARYYAGKTVLLIGGAGQLGTYMAEMLSEVDRCVFPVLDNKFGLNFLEDRDRLWRECAAADVIVNLAARVGGASFNASSQFQQAVVNVQLQAAPLEAAAACGKPKRFVQVSSACVYEPSSLPLQEEWGWSGDPEGGNYGYGFAKRVGERLACIADSHTSLECLIVRPTNMYSERCDFADPNGHVISRLVYQVLRGDDPIRARGDGEQRRSFIHAKDCAAGILTACASEYRGIVNIASPDDMTINDLRETIFNACGVSPSVEYDLSASTGSQRRMLCGKKLRRILEDAGLSWAPKIAFADGIAEMVAECKTQMARSREIQSPV